MLFRINVYRQGRERRLETIRRVRSFAILVAVLCVNAVVIGLFVFAIAMSERGIAAVEARLTATQQALAKVVDEQGGSTTDEELGLVRMRAERVLWSRVMRAVATLTPKEMWLPRVMLSQSDSGYGVKIPGLRLSGRMTATSEEDGIRILMELVNGLRGDQYFRKHFLEPKLLRSTWLTEEGSRHLEFEVFSPLNTPEAIQTGATPIPDADWNTIDDAGIEKDDAVDFDDKGEGSERTS